jgi:co-chaperonin GroES (HSP10)
MNIQPLGDRVVIKLDQQKQEEKLESGIYIAKESDDKTNNKQGKIVAAGPGKKDQGSLSVSEGDRVLFSWGDSVTINDEEYYIVKEENILAIIQ